MLLPRNALPSLMTLARCLILLICVSASRAGAQCDPAWLGLADFPGVDGIVHCVVAWDPDADGPAEEFLVAGGEFALAGDITAHNIAAWTGEEWIALGDGFDAAVRAVAVYQGQLYAGGEFLNTGMVSRPRLARWNGATWENPGFTPNATVRAMCVHDSKLYAGGNFALASKIVATFDGATWTSIGTGGGIIHALASTSQGLVIAGNHAGFDGITAKNIARWDGSAWHALGPGLNKNVFSVTEHNGEIIAGGQFTASGSVPLNHVAAWNGTEWTDLGGSSSGTEVKFVRSWNGSLYVGGSFKIHDIENPIYGLAKREGDQWVPALPKAPFPGLVYAMCPWRETWAVGGQFVAPRTGATSVAFAQDDQLAPCGSGLDTQIMKMLPTRQGIFVGGYFRGAGGVSGGATLWNGSAWLPLGTGTRHYVSDFVEFEDDVIVAGYFDIVDDSTWSPNVARWSNGAWVPMPLEVEGAGMSLTTLNGELFVGGQFFTPELELWPGVYRWTGTQWAPVGDGLNGRVYLTTVYNRELIALGTFTASGKNPALGAARFDGTLWRQLGNGISPRWYQSVIEYNGDLIVASNSPPYLQRWDGASWTTLGDAASQPNGSVRALSVMDGVLYAAGTFTAIGTSPISRLAIWNGAEWSQGPSSAAWGPEGNESPFTMVESAGRLVIGGLFTNAGPVVSPHFAAYTPTGEPWIVAMPADVSITCGQSATLSINAASAIPVNTYQWQRETSSGSGVFVPVIDGPSPWGSSILGADSPSLHIDNAQAQDSGLYHCAASNSCGTSTSLNSHLTVSGIECCLGDYTDDLTVDILDFLDFFEDFAACDQLPAPCGTLGNPDVNADTIVDILDLLDFLNAFGNGC